MSIVKRLDWEAPCKKNNYGWVARTILGTYFVANDDGWHALLEDGMSWEWVPENDPRSYSDQLWPMEACEDHFRKTILSAIEEAHVAKHSPPNQTDEVK